MIARRSLSRMLVSLCAVVGGLLFVWSAPVSAQRLHEFSKSFGSEGSGDGQLSRPGELAVSESTGDVYVIDRGNGRVEIFSSTGAYVGQFNGSASPTGAFSWPIEPPGQTTVAEGGIAVDNSTNPLDPSKGDVYVVDTGHGVIDKFSSNGAYIGQLTGRSPTISFPVGAGSSGATVAAVGVDLNGELWVQINEVLKSLMYIYNDAVANEYVSEVEPKRRFHGEEFAGAFASGFALDSEDNFYIGLSPNQSNPVHVPAEFSKVGEALNEELDGEDTTGFAVDGSSEDVYVDHETNIAAYSPSDALIERFGSAQMASSEGIAVNSVTGTVYASNTAGATVDVFAASVVPDVSTGSASNFAETSVTLNGVVNPDGLPVTACVFEYGATTEYGQTAECAPSPGSGGAPVSVSANLSGLERLTGYHFRLKVSNANGTNVGKDRAFVTPEPVTLSEESVTDISSSSALFGVQVNPGGADTTYAFEYGTSVSYGESVPVPAGDLGAGMSSVPVAVRAEGLLGETTYHVRVVAVSVLGTVYGPDLTFTTQSAGGAFVLPDGREWELVSPAAKDGANIEPLGRANQFDGGLIESSVDGGAVTYVANGPVGSGAVGNLSPQGPAQVLSRRGAQGWSSEDITLPHRAAGEAGNNEYQFFSSDFSRALVEPTGEPPLSPEATELTPYLRENDSGSYVPLVTAGNVTPGIKFGPHLADGPSVVAATPDLSHVLLFSEDALTGSAPGLFEWSGGQLQPVTAATRPYFERRQLSSDGSRVVFERETTGSLSGLNVGVFSRDMVSGQTVEVDQPAPGVSPPPARRARFQIASSDGSKVFFTDEEPLTLDSKLEPQSENNHSGMSDLYVYSTVTGSLTDLSVDRNAGEQASVQGEVLGGSEDGSIVYFVAKGVLATGAQAGKDNLYVESETGSSWSAPRLVAVLSEKDGNDWAINSGGGAGNLTSRVSPNGRYVVFMSERSVTGYDNRDAISGQPDEEVFLYDEAASQVRCVSCDPTGARPDGLFDRGGEREPLADKTQLWGGRWLAGNIPEWTPVNDPGTDVEIAYPSRVVSNEGRLFFNSFDSLVAQDTNGKADVYEYEPEGVGGCARPGGCVALISSGTSGEESAFLDASENGSDVFFLTAARLTRQDVDTSLDVYDAHVCSQAVPCVSVPVSPPACTSGDSCKAAPSPQPAIFGAPSSATFSGAGNVTPSQPAGSASTPKQSAKKKPSDGRRKAKGKRKGRRGSRGRGKSLRARRSLSAGTRR